MNNPVVGPSFAEQLEPFFPYLPSDLIGAGCLDQIRSVTRHLPGELGVGPFLFECGLDDRPAADFSVAVIASRGDPAALCRPGTAVPPGWGRIRPLARSWEDATSPLSGTVEEAWLEFDVGLTGTAPCATPSVFVRLDGSAPVGGHLRVAEEALVLLQGRPLLPATLAGLTDCFAFLPAGARVLFVGAMLSRSSDAVRVVASGMDLADMVRYLQRLDVRGAEDHLARLADIAGMADELWLAFDVDETGVGPRIGLDCYRNDRSWSDPLALLAGHGICTGRKRDALLEAGDMSRASFDEQAWPASLRRMATILGPAGFGRMDLYIHHVKVITGPAERLEAKAYLCGTYR